MEKTTIDLKCGAKAVVERNTLGFYVTVSDHRRFWAIVEQPAWEEDGHFKLELYFNHEALPGLRSVLREISRQNKEAAKLETKKEN